MYKIEFTKEELDGIIIQVGARIDDLKEIQKREGKSGNINRVLEIEKFIQPIISAKDKMMFERYK
jgi:hypothetical protein